VPASLTSPDATSIAAVVDPHFDRAMETGRAPGLVYAVVMGGRVVHCGGLGQRHLSADRPETGSAPDVDTVFRIASMTKSFTAVTVLSLRDEGAFALDTPVVEFVPELASAAGTSAVTIRHLLTMGGGFLTDDPWGDRQQDLAIPAFRQLLRSGVGPSLTPGERFEYSNLGYAILGLVVESATGEPYTQVVGERLLRPLGLASSGYLLNDLPANRAAGYVRRTTGWAEEPVAGSGAFSPMGGVLSSVRDLARWVGLFQAVDDDAQWSDVPLVHLRQTSVREMQVTQRLVAATAGRAEGAAPEVTGYGFGLFEDFRDWGRSVYHSGGYPGFGSHMRWHPASGLGVVALANGSYAPMSTVATAALGDLVVQLGADRHVPPLDLPALDAARAAVTDWLSHDDPEGPTSVLLRQMCADNVETDVPWAERVAVWGQLRQTHGVLEATDDPPTRPSPGSMTWQMRGERGLERLKVTVMVAPHDPRLLQSLEVKTIDSIGVSPPSATDLT
jgi:CubicO group peptidase (beta-lactamase class C family)